MSKKIAIITSKSVHEHTASSLERLQPRLDPDWEIRLLIYDSFACLPGLYDQYAGEVDGFLVSGQVAQAAIERREHAVRKPLMYFQADPAELYRVILCYLLEHPGANIDRVILDFLLPLGGGLSAERFLREMELPELKARVSGWVDGMTLEQLERLEASIVRRAAALWAERKADMVICLYSSIVPVLRAQGVPCCCPLVEDLHLLDLIHRLQTKIELERLRAHMPAVVSVSPRRKAEEGNMAVLRRYLKRFLRESLLECVLQEKPDCCDIFTSVSVMHYLTDHCRSSRLAACLERDLPFQTAVGYGVGTDVNQAVRNAQIARREAEFAGRSFIRSENGELTGPLGTEKPLVVDCRSSREAGEIAKRCGLSALTIQKLAASVKQTGSDKVTTQQMADRFGMTVRNANRILGRLVEGGYAHVAYFQTTNSKGRPVKVYELTLSDGGVSFQPGGRERRDDF